MTRARIPKTLKLYVGGRFIRSESGRLIQLTAASGDAMYAAAASRKDLRETVRIARAAQAAWAKRTAYNRGQILYRLAEMLEDRGLDGAAADRAVHHAGWADKITALLSSVNPVATGHVDYTMIRPMGVITAVPSAADGLLGMVEAISAITVMGNAVILLVPAEAAEVAAQLAEALHTSDVPHGLVNIMTSDVPALLDWVDKLDDLDGLYIAGGALDAERLAASQAAAARVLRRVVVAPAASTPAPPWLLGQLAEAKTVWMSA